MALLSHSDRAACLIWSTKLELGRGHERRPGGGARLARINDVTPVDLNVRSCCLKAHPLALAKVHRIIKHDPAFVTDCGLKGLNGGRADLDDVLVLPRARRNTRLRPQNVPTG